MRSSALALSSVLIVTTVHVAQAQLPIEEKFVIDQLKRPIAIRKAKDSLVFTLAEATRIEQVNPKAFAEKVLYGPKAVAVAKVRSEFYSFKYLDAPREHPDCAAVQLLSKEEEKKVTGVICRELNVKFKRGVPAEGIAQLNAKIGATVIRAYESVPGLYLLKGASDGAATAARYTESSLVEWAAPDLILPVELSAGTLNDPLAQNQWYLNEVDAFGAWSITTGRTGAIIAVLDNGVDINHEDLKINVVPGHNALEPGQPATPDGVLRNCIGSHGTAVAGLVAGVSNNGRGIAGICPSCKIMPIKVFGDNGFYGQDSTFNAMVWAVDNGATVLNISWGVPFPMSQIYEGIKYALDRGRVVVAAGGNGGRRALAFPAAHAEVFAIGAVDRNRRKWPYSNSGKNLMLTAPSGDLSCRGDIFTTSIMGKGVVHGHYLNNFGGTSAAAPIVSGVVGLMLSVKPGLRPNQVRLILQKHAVPLGGKRPNEDYGFGLVQAKDAVAEAAGLKGP